MYEYDSEEEEENEEEEEADLPSARLAKTAVPSYNSVIASHS